MQIKRLLYLQYVICIRDYDTSLETIGKNELIELMCY